jgi:hypothetical protein
MSDAIKSIDTAINAIVRNKAHMFLMAGQSIVEWFRYAVVHQTIKMGRTLPDNKPVDQFNFVPIMRQFRMLERKMDAEKNSQLSEGKLTNVMTFGMGLASIFEQVVYHDEEKKLPMFDFYIGNNLREEVRHENKEFINSIDVPEGLSKTIIVMDIEEKDCTNIDSNHLEQWKQPFAYSIGNLNIIESNSSHYLYLGYLYLLALAWNGGMNVINVCSKDLLIFDSINEVISYVNNTYQDFLIKPVLENPNPDNAP